VLLCAGLPVEPALCLQAVMLPPGAWRVTVKGQLQVQVQV
jgi:hypothetical protein